MRKAIATHVGFDLRASWLQVHNVPVRWTAVYGHPRASAPSRRAHVSQWLSRHPRCASFKTGTATHGCHRESKYRRSTLSLVTWVGGEDRSNRHELSNSYTVAEVNAVSRDLDCSWFPKRGSLFLMQPRRASNSHWFRSQTVVIIAATLHESISRISQDSDICECQCTYGSVIVL